MAYPVSNPSGFRYCKSCTHNDGVFESEECVSCYHHPLLNDNYEKREEEE